MTVTATTQLSDAVETLSQATEQAISNESADDFEAVARALEQTGAMARETHQAMWSEEAADTIRRLESNQPLTEANRQAIRTFLIADAEHYLAIENNFDDWIAELRRLLSEMARLASEIDRESIGELRGVFKDATRLLPGIHNYLEERRRVERFDLATGSLDATSRDLLVKLLKEQLHSPNR